MFPFLQSCRDKDTPTYECTPDITVLLPEKALSMFYFKPGSYWIYQREDSLYTDSVWVTASVAQNIAVNTKYSPDFKGKKCYEYRSTTLMSGKGYFFDNVEFAFLTPYPIIDSSYSNELFFVYENLDLISGKSSLCRAIFKGNRLVEDNGFGDSSVLLDSIQIRNTIFSNVLMFRKNASFPDYLKEAYYTSNIGMIRFKDIHDSWWNLIRYNIIQ